MSFNGNEGGEISLAEGAAMTAKYRTENPTKLKGHFFGKDILTKILEQDGCMGIRMYYGIDSNEKQQLVIVGADSDENDMLELVADLSFPCPDACSTPNPLNK